MGIEQIRPVEKFPQTLYKTAKAPVSWGEGVVVWVEVTKNEDKTYNVEAKIEDPQEVLGDVMDFLPTSIMNLEDATKAKKEADKLFENRDKWAGQ